ncbi:MAG: hypothetical protein JXR31_05070 [Prolixibacteraceae bacterium]|nr:hypothetical protein [Prolixibacteraceae bacterium]MBN2773597.1 hypothetical protein [Prolixibacteraceae bacterium]
MNRKYIAIIVFVLFPVLTRSQCLSSVNPVGGTDNLLVLEKKSLRVITFYKFGQGNRYYEKNKHADFNLINRAFYNYVSTSIGYGLTYKLTLELETGYFFNKSQEYNLDPIYKLTGKGISNFVLLAKHSLFTDPVKRIYLTGGLGLKIPGSRNPQYVKNVQLPVEVQPTIGAYGTVMNAIFVKENSGTGMRYFFTSRVESNAPNKKDYRLGTAVFTSVYISKHLMFPRLKGDWTTILQVRNEFRGVDKIEGVKKESSGSNLFFITPQINYVIKEKWYLSAMTDVPVYQYFKGTQLGAGVGLTFIVSRTFRL